MFVLFLYRPASCLALGEGRRISLPGTRVNGSQETGEDTILTLPSPGRPPPRSSIPTPDLRPPRGPYPLALRASDGVGIGVILFLVPSLALSLALEFFGHLGTPLGFQGALLSLLGSPLGLLGSPLGLLGAPPGLLGPPLGCLAALFGFLDPALGFLGAFLGLRDLPLCFAPAPLGFLGARFG